jgi:NTP pyrophosphatase (non-canonical NTP hydrolase)
MVLGKHDKRNQLLKLIEELAELLKATSDVLRDDTITDNFREELADVYVMCQQAQMIFKITDEDINDMAEKKLDRTLINEEKLWTVKVDFLRCDSEKPEYNRTFKIKANSGKAAEQIVFNGLSIMEFTNFKIVGSER